MGVRGLAALVFALVALGGFILVDRNDGDADRDPLERKIAEVLPCPGERPPPVSCRRVPDGGWDCRIGGPRPDRIVTPPDGHFEISQIC